MCCAARRAAHARRGLRRASVSLAHACSPVPCCQPRAAAAPAAACGGSGRVWRQLEQPARAGVAVRGRVRPLRRRCAALWPGPLTRPRLRRAVCCAHSDEECQVAWSKFLSQLHVQDAPLHRPVRPPPGQAARRTRPAEARASTVSRARARRASALCCQEPCADHTPVSPTQSVAAADSGSSARCASAARCCAKRHLRRVPSPGCLTRAASGVHPSARAALMSSCLCIGRRPSFARRSGAHADPCACCRCVPSHSVWRTR